MTNVSVVDTEIAHEYGCYVDNYMVGHGKLLVCVEHHAKQERFYVDFNHVYCFSGILRWNGAGLRLGSDEEYMQFMQLMMPTFDKPYEELQDPNYYGKLYIFDSKTGPIKFIATNHRKVDHLLQEITS